MPHSILVDGGDELCACGETTVIIEETGTGAEFEATCPNCQNKYRITQDMMPIVVLKLHEIFHGIATLGRILRKEGHR